MDHKGDVNIADLRRDLSIPSLGTERPCHSTVKMEFYDMRPKFFQLLNQSNPESKVGPSSTKAQRLVLEPGKSLSPDIVVYKIKESLGNEESHQVEQEVIEESVLKEVDLMPRREQTVVEAALLRSEPRPRSTGKSFTNPGEMENESRRYIDGVLVSRPASINKGNPEDSSLSLLNSENELFKGKSRENWSLEEANYRPKK